MRTGHGAGERIVGQIAAERRRDVVEQQIRVADEPVQLIAVKPETAALMAPVEALRPERVSGETAAASGTYHRHRGTLRRFERLTGMTVAAIPTR
jgi:hypothetical protein